MSEDKKAEISAVEGNSSLLEDASTLLMFHNTVLTKEPVFNKQVTSNLREPISPVIQQKEIVVKKSPIQPVISVPVPVPIPVTVNVPETNEKPAPEPVETEEEVETKEEQKTVDETVEKDKDLTAVATPVVGSVEQFSAQPPQPLSKDLDEEALTDIEDFKKEQDQDETQTQGLGLGLVQDPVQDPTQDQVQDQDQDQDQYNTEDESKVKPVKQEKVKKPRKHKKKETKQVPKEYIVHPDSGLISCVCNYDHDDGFTIQCDYCNRWQHASCMGIESMDNVPDDYLCNICQPRDIDARRAKIIQTKFLNQSKKKNSNKRSASVDPENDVSGSSKEREKEKDSKEKDFKEAKDSKDSKDSKPKPKPKENPYNKNLDDTEIIVPDEEHLYDVTYYEIEDYEYEDEIIENYVKDVRNFDKIKNIIKLSNKEFNSMKAELFTKNYSETNIKKFNGIFRLGLYSDDSIQPNEIISEYVGVVCSKFKYIENSRNKYKLIGVEKPQVVFLDDLPILIDSRMSGNLTRFIRRSCRPNCVIKPVIVGKSAVKFVLVATKAIKSQTELTIPWNWCPSHPMNKLISGEYTSFDAFDDFSKHKLITTVESLLTFVECGCVQNNDCFLSKIKKSSIHLHRNLRKIGTVANNAANILEPEFADRKTSIQQRLENSYKTIISDINEMDAIEKDSLITKEVNNGDNVEKILIKPFIYSYLHRKRHYSETLTQDENLPVPIEILPEIIDSNNLNGDSNKSINISNNVLSNDNNNDKSNNPNDISKDKNADNMKEKVVPPRPVKKLSFADYVKKKKPTN